MKLLFLGLNFSPELTGVGKFSGEMCEYLASIGHDIRVICAPPYYPEWQVRTGHSAWRWRVERIGGCLVYRCPIYIPKVPGGLRRLIHLFSFAASSFPIVLWMIFWRPNLVLVVEPSLASVPGALLLRKLLGARLWLHVQDFEVDAAFDLGVLFAGRRLRAAAFWLEHWIMLRFDRVSTISGRMLDRLLVKGVDPRRACLIPNWVDVSRFSTDLAWMDSRNLRAELGINPTDVVALYSGNMGGKQGLDVLADVARICADRGFSFGDGDSSGNGLDFEPSLTRLVFIFCGTGPFRLELERRCSGLNNVLFLDLLPLDRFPALMRAADVHILPQRADAADLVMPSKLCAMAACGGAIVATASAGTELATVVGRFGVVVAPGHAEALANAVVRLAKEPIERDRLGGLARDYAVCHWDRLGVLREFSELVDMGAWSRDMR